MEARIECFPPVARGDARLLILGTMPSVESLRQSFYYAHPRNAFWPVMAEVLGAPVPETVEEKRALLTGSLDSAMRDILPNDFDSLYARCPKIERILFNGDTARKLYMRLVGRMPEGCDWARMPSTSPAYTLPYARKLDAWRAGMEGYYD